MASWNEPKLGKNLSKKSLNISLAPSCVTDQLKFSRLPNEDGKPGKRIELYVDETVHQNAQRYFATARTFKDKSKGAEKALEDTSRKQKCAKDIENADCYLRQGAGGTKTARFGSRTCFLR